MPKIEKERVLIFAMRYGIILLGNSKKDWGNMKNFEFNARDVHWGYSEKTGAIPFIINDKKTRLKQLEDDLVLDITVDIKSTNPLSASINTLSAYYDEDMSYVGFTAMFAYVNMFQNLKQFGFQELDGYTRLDMEDIAFLQENYNTKMGKKLRKQREAEERERQEEEDRFKTFNF